MIKSAKYSVLILVLVTAASCTNTFSSSDLAKTGAAGTLPTLTSIQPEGAWVVSQKLPSNFFGHYQSGCSTPGTVSPQLQTDPRLSVGMKWVETFRTYQPGFTLLQGKASATLVAKSSSLTMLSGSVSESSIVGIDVGLSGSRTCNLSGTSFSCAYLPIPNISFPSGRYTSCAMPTKTQSSFDISSGIYTNSVGTSFNGWEISADWTGDLICDGKNLGRAVGTHHLIVTNETPADDRANFCGGVPLFVSWSYKLADGTLIRIDAIERLSSPKVNP